jgi:uncharacterized protein with NRDE domain
MKLVLLTLALFAFPAFATKQIKETTIFIYCQKVTAGATDAVRASIVVGTTDDDSLVKRLERSFTINGTQATQLATVCTAVENAAKTADSIP